MLIFSRSNSMIFSTEGGCIFRLIGVVGKEKYHLYVFGDNLPKGELILETYDNVKDAEKALIALADALNAYNIG